MSQNKWPLLISEENKMEISMFAKSTCHIQSLIIVWRLCRYETTSFKLNKIFFFFLNLTRQIFALLWLDDFILHELYRHMFHNVLVPVSCHLGRHIVILIVMII